jgi:hypothetical protein
MTLPRIQPPAGRGLEPVQRGPGSRPGHARSRRRAGGCEQARLGVQHLLAGVPAGGVLDEHRFPIATAQHGRLIEQRWRLNPQAPPWADRRRDDRFDHLLVLGRRAEPAPGADQPLGLGAQIPHRPGGPLMCHPGHRSFSKILNIRRAAGT